MHKLFDDPYLILAHRGASREAPENTPAAFSRAFELGADGIELDIQLSSDGELVVIHDETVNRTTNGRGRVGRKTLAELKNLDAGRWFAEQFAGEKVPTLAEVLSIAGGFLVDIEIKKRKSYEVLLERLFALIDQQPLKSYLFSSFDEKVIEEIKSIRQDSVTGLLLNTSRKNLEGSWDFVLPHHRLADVDFMDRAAKGKKKIIVWTVDDEREAVRLLNLGIGRFISNEPAKLQKILNEAKNGLTRI